MQHGQGTEICVYPPEKAMGSLTPEAVVAFTSHWLEGRNLHNASLTSVTGGKAGEAHQSPSCLDGMYSPSKH